MLKVKSNLSKIMDRKESLSPLPTNIDIQYYGLDVPTLDQVLRPILTITTVEKQVKR